MSQPIPQAPRSGAALQTLSDAREDDAQAQVDTLKIVACSVCRAVYVPASAEVVQHSLPALEAAFLEVCRFCFRCQRPACPQCWNPVHHVCAACSEEARLPFRSPVPALEGLVFLAPSSAQMDQAGRLSFTCQRNGRFYIPEPAPVQTEPRVHALAVTPAVTSDVLPALSTDGQKRAPSSFPAPSLPDANYPTWLQEVLGQQASGPIALARVDEARPTYQPQESAVNWSYTGQTGWPQAVPGGTHPPIPMPTLQAPGAQQAFQPQGAPVFPIQPVLAPSAQPQSPAPTVAEEEGQNPSIAPQENPVQEEEEFSIFERIENFLIVITSVLLLAVVSMIVLSISFVPVNTFFLSLLHIDIRTEIAYLLQLR